MIPEVFPVILVLFAYCLCYEADPLSLINNDSKEMSDYDSEEMGDYDSEEISLEEDPYTIEPPTLIKFGAKETPLEEVPYTVSIIQNNNHICGGIIVHEQWIITAAHCVEDKYDLEIQAGLVNLLNPGRYLQKIEVEEVFLHPSYVNRYDSVDCDIALLVLAEELEFNLAVESISIMSPNQLNSFIKTHQPALMTGWGSGESAVASASNRLFSAELDLLSNQDCLNIFPKCDEFIPDAHVCSSTWQSERISGFLDDGAPLVLMDKLGGLVINGKQNRNINRPILSTVYAAVPFHQDFIYSHLPYLYTANGEQFPSNLTEKKDSWKFDLILVSEPTTNSIENTKTFTLTYKIHFSEGLNIAKPERVRSRSQGSKCSKESDEESDVEIEKWVLSIEIVHSKKTPEENAVLVPRSEYIVNANLVKYIK